MNTGRIEAALLKANDTADVGIGSGLLPSVNEMFERSFGGQRAVVVADENTFGVAGDEVRRHLEAAGRPMVDPYVFPGRPTLHAEYAHIERLTQALHAHDAIPIAVGSGRVFGVGFGQGRQQYGFLPLAYDDFIAANIGEERGFIGLAFVILMFALFAILGFRIARNARTPFLQLTAIGITTTIVLTAFLHIGVVIGLLPTTGLTLPFISYGRSNLVLSMLMTGILVNIGSTREKVIGGRATDPSFVLERA